jgi:predicted nuclease of predicted toxin-antitoxin system
MKILLDECIDRRLAREFVGYEVKTVPQMGWAGINDGQLLVLAAVEFDVFITVDRNLSFQQNLPQFNIAVIVLKARSNRLVDLKPLVIKVIAILSTADRGQATTVCSDNAVS